MTQKIIILIKKYWVLFLTFFIINIFIMAISISIFNLESQFKVTNSLFTENSKTIVFNNIKEKYFSDLLDIIGDEKIVISTSPFQNNNKSKSLVSGIYYNYELEKTYPIIEGRMFTSSEINNNENVALIGYDLKSDINENDEILIKNKIYKVVGIIGSKTPSMLNDKIYINLTSMNLPLDNQAITIDNKTSGTLELCDKIYFKLIKNQDNPNIFIGEPNIIINPLQVAIGDNRIYIYISVFLIICLISTIINISYYWIENEKNTLGVKRLVGGTNRRLMLNFYLEYQTLIILSLVMVVIVFSCLYRTKLLTLIDFNINNVLKSLLVMELLNLITSTLAIIPSLLKLNRMEINTIIKETN